MSREEKKKEGPGEFGAMEINAGEGREARPPAVSCPEKLRVVLNYGLQRGGGEGECCVSLWPVLTPRLTGLRRLASSTEVEDSSSQGALVRFSPPTPAHTLLSLPLS